MKLSETYSVRGFPQPTREPKEDEASKTRPDQPKTVTLKPDAGSITTKLPR